MSGPNSQPSVLPAIDRTHPEALVEQVAAALRSAVFEGRLAPGARLPSARDLAAQLGVARGTVRAAYERLVDERLLFSAGAAGTRVVLDPLVAPPEANAAFEPPLRSLLHAFSSRPLPFQMGVPANDAFPAKLWARTRVQALRDDALGYTSYADPRGEPALRAQIARQVAISRRLKCVPDQVFVTSGYRQGLSLILQALDVHGRVAWMEEPGFLLGRRALEIAGMSTALVPVDADGLDVAQGLAMAKDALIALVTPGQQAPLGVALSPARRSALLAWAAETCAWIIEDDYLSELQLDGRAAPALASEAGADRVLHVGSLSKTFSPALGLGFVVSPLSLVDRLAEVAAVMLPAPNRTTQLGVANFMADGHYLRHLRRMKALYHDRRNLLTSKLKHLGCLDRMAGMALLLPLPAAVEDTEVAARGPELGIAPAPLSTWFANSNGSSKGLLLSVTNIDATNVDDACRSLALLLSGEEGNRVEIGG